MCVIVSGNDRIKKTNKKYFYITYLLIALSALAEWTGLNLDGVESLPKWPLMIVKCADYCLTPMAGGALIGQMNIRNRWSKVLTIILLTNIVFQIVSCFGGWMIRIDELSLATGYALAEDHPGITVENLVIEADRAMYSKKNEFYLNSGIDRRKY